MRDKKKQMFIFFSNLRFNKVLKIENSYAEILKILIFC